jgi:transcriptional regulator with XRE-family HTH domain
MIQEIKKAMELNNVSTSVLADAIGINKYTLYSFLLGRYKISFSKLESIINFLDIELVAHEFSAEKKKEVEQIMLNRQNTSTVWQAAWDRMFEKVKNYHDNTGTWPSSSHRDATVKRLGIWCAVQRAKKRSGKLKDKRKQMLDSLHFDWRSTLEDGWREMFEALKNYRDKTERWPSLSSKNKNESKLARWLMNQRAVARGQKNSKLPQDRLEKLESINFMKNDPPGRKKIIEKSSAVIFDRKEKDNGIGLVCTQPRLSLWNRVYEEVKEYRQSTGNWPALNSQDTKIRNLCMWCNRQREYLKRGCLSQEKQAKLNAIGFEWVLRTHDWNAMYEIVKKYRESTGKWPVASSKDAEIAKLGRWCGLQRHRMKKGILSSEQQTKLKEIEM